MNPWDWLNDNGPAMQVVFAGVLAVVTGVYAWRTHVISKATRDQADATARLAEATLCPVLEQWTHRTPLPDPGRQVRLEIVYKNSGDGPAIDIRWALLATDGRLLSMRRRVGMGRGEDRGQVEFDVDETLARQGLSVQAEYQGLFSAIWRSSLQVKADNGHLVNGDAAIEKIGARIIE